MKAQVTKMQATSRMSVKINDNFYTIEYTEERSLPNEEFNLVDEKQELFNSVNATVDEQIKDIVDSLTKERYNNTTQYK